MENVFIYSLKDPRTGEIRYVGKTIKPKKRLNSDGFYNASGRYVLGCKVCQRQDGTTYFAQSGSCISGDSCFSSVTKTKKLQ